MNIEICVPTSSDSFVSVSIDIPCKVSLDDLVPIIKCTECLSDSFESYVDVPIVSNGCVVTDNYLHIVDYKAVRDNSDRAFISFTR